MSENMTLINVKITLVEIDTYSKTPLEDALTALRSKEDPSSELLTHTVIAAFQRLDTVFFAQLSACRVDSTMESDIEISAAYGK